MFALWQLIGLHIEHHRLECRTARTIQREGKVGSDTVLNSEPIVASTAMPAMT
jgi:hypothetical protein